MEIAFVRIDEKGIQTQVIVTAPSIFNITVADEQFGTIGDIAGLVTPKNTVDNGIFVRWKIRIFGQMEPTNPFGRLIVGNGTIDDLLRWSKNSRVIFVQGISGGVLPGTFFKHGVSVVFFETKDNNFIKAYEKDKEKYYWYTEHCDRIAVFPKT